MNASYYAAEALWREAWRLALEAKATPTGTAEREIADTAFSLALSEALAALEHPHATNLAQLTDECVMAVKRIAEAQSATLATAEGSPERDAANAAVIAAHVDAGRAAGVDRALEERISHHIGDVVPEDAAERVLYFQAAAALALYGVGGLLPRILLTLAGVVGTLPEGRIPPLLQPRKLGRGEAGTTQLEDSLQQTIALRMLQEALLAGYDSGFTWVEETQPGVTGRTYTRWIASAGAAEQACVTVMVGRMLRQEPLTETEQALYDRLNQRSLQKMLEGLSIIT